MTILLADLIVVKVVRCWNASLARFILASGVAAGPSGRLGSGAP